MGAVRRSAARISPRSTFAFASSGKLSMPITEAEMSQYLQTGLQHEHPHRLMSCPNAS